MPVLDADPDLGAGLDERELELARARTVAPLVELAPPHWDPSSLRAAAQEGWVGLLVVEGLMIRRVRVGKRSAGELFGPGDMVRPWDADGEYDPLPIDVAWDVLSVTRLALLDGAFSQRVARWPAIQARLVGRVAQRARYLGLLQAVTHLPRAYLRLLILFWLLAERWGRVGPDGVRVTLPLTHEVLAMLVGAQRPTVTIALQRLARAELLIRERRDRWLLSNVAIERLEAPESIELIDDPHDGGEDREPAGAGDELVAG